MIFLFFILLKNLSSGQTWCNQQANKLCLGSGSCRIRVLPDPALASVGSALFMALEIGSEMVESEKGGSGNGHTKYQPKKNNNNMRLFIFFTCNKFPPFKKEDYYNIKELHISAFTSE